MMKPSAEKTQQTHLVFADVLSPVLIKFLRRQAAKHPQVVCYVELERKRAERLLKRLPDNVSVRWFGKDEQVFDHRVSAYAIGRKLSNAITSRLKDCYPDFFKLGKTPYDFESVYHFSLIFTFARHRLNFLLNALDLIARTEFDQVTIIHPLYVNQATWPVLTDLFPQLAHSRCQALSLLELPDTACSLKLKCQAMELRYWLKRRMPQFAKLDLARCKNSVLTYARVSHHLTMMEPTLQALQSEHPVALLNYFSKSFKRENAAFFDRFADSGESLYLFEPRAFYPNGDLMHTVHRHFAQLADAILKSCDLPESDRQFLWSHLQHMQFLSKQFFRLESIVRRIQPKAVVGCMEADSFGLIFQELQKTYPFKLINVLHGIAPYFDASDLFRFDAFFIWNQQTKNVLLEDGYLNADTLKIVGHPQWTASADITAISPDTEQIEEILQWRGDDKLIVAYSQPGTNYTTPKQRHDFFQTLLQYLQTHPGVKLLVKKHPNEFDTIAEDMAAVMCLQDRIRLYKAKELPLYDSIRVADLTVSICSTVLLEALYYRIPAIALDFEGVNAALGNGLDKVTPVVLQAEDADRIISEILALGMTHPAFDPKHRELIYPLLQNTYAERVSVVLAELGLLAGRASDMNMLSGQYQQEEAQEVIVS